MLAVSPVGTWHPRWGTDGAEQARIARLPQDYGLSRAVVLTQPLACHATRGQVSYEHTLSRNITAGFNASAGWGRVDITQATEELRRYARLPEAANTTPTCSRISRHKAMCESATAECAPWYSDAIHFQPFVYHELNLLTLLELGC
eukprot:Hpha_TRINITY_DN7268_c0_g1::TRINITY_DN7268_c0_g1_i1::g.102220::m.102220